MHERCYNPKQDGFKYYGGAGIRVCDRWEKFSNFLADMGARPSKAHSIDRIDVTRGYEPGNCRWATHPEQCANRRTTKNVVEETPQVLARRAYRAAYMRARRAKLKEAT